MSFLTQSHQVFFGRPLCLIPSTSHVIQRLTQSLSSFRSTCPNHLNRLFLITKLTGSNPKSCMSSSLFFLSFSSHPTNHTHFCTTEHSVEQLYNSFQYNRRQLSCRATLHYTYGRRAFDVAGPSVWNSLSDISEIRLLAVIASDAR